MTTSITIVALLFGHFGHPLTWFGSLALGVALLNRLVLLHRAFSDYLQPLRGKASPVTMISINLGPTFLTTALILYGGWDHLSTWFMGIVFGLFHIAPLIFLTNYDSEP